MIIDDDERCFECTDNLAAGWDPGVYGLKTQAHTELTLGGLGVRTCAVRNNRGFLEDSRCAQQTSETVFFHSFHIVSIFSNVLSLSHWKVEGCVLVCLIHCLAPGTWQSLTFTTVNQVHFPEFRIMQLSSRTFPSTVLAKEPRMMVLYARVDRWHRKAECFDYKI